MVKRIFVGMLIAISTFGVFSISEAHHDSHDSDCYRDGYHCR